MGLVAIVGKDALSERDRMFSEFADLFENRFVRQGYDEDRTIFETLDGGWNLPVTLPVEQPGPDRSRPDQQSTTRSSGRVPRRRSNGTWHCAISSPQRSELINLKRRIVLSGAWLQDPQDEARWPDY